MERLTNADTVAIHFDTGQLSNDLGILLPQPMFRRCVIFKMADLSLAKMSLLVTPCTSSYQQPTMVLLTLVSELLIALKNECRIFFLSFTLILSFPP